MTTENQTIFTSEETVPTEIIASEEAVTIAAEVTPEIETVETVEACQDESQGDVLVAETTIVDSAE